MRNQLNDLEKQLKEGRALDLVPLALKNQMNNKRQVVDLAPAAPSPAPTPVAQLKPSTPGRVPAEPVMTEVVAVPVKSTEKLASESRPVTSSHLPLLFGNL
jgi:hypothetical protein